MSGKLSNWKPTEDKLDRVMRMQEVTWYVAMSRSAIYEKINLGEFPEGIKLGKRARGWRKSSIDDWLTAQEEAA